MPRSSGEGKLWTCDRIAVLQPTSVLDIGPGVGTYHDLLHTRLFPQPHWSCIEIFEPYVDKYSLRGKYSTVIVGDARTEPFPTVDVVILGDVLEHLHLDDAIKVWAKARAAARKAVFLSLPIIEYPQGELEGNIHETHLHTWSHQLVLDSLPGIVDHATYREIGVYQANPDDAFSDALELDC